jgi:hypothetical protein
MAQGRRGRLVVLVALCALQTPPTPLRTRWCTSTLIAAPSARLDGTAPIDSPLDTAVRWWRSRGLGISLHALRTPAPSDPGAGVLVFDLGEPGELATYWPDRVRRTPSGLCVERATVTLGDRFRVLTPAQQAQTLAHEIGHALGLDHRPDTLMDGRDTVWPGWVLHPDDDEALRRAYPDEPDSPADSRQPALRWVQPTARIVTRREPIPIQLAVARHAQNRALAVGWAVNGIEAGSFTVELEGAAAPVLQPPTPRWASADEAGELTLVATLWGVHGRRAALTLTVLVAFDADRDGGRP